MLGQSNWRALISGQRGGIRAATLRALLACMTPAYRLAVGWRNRRLDRGRGVLHCSVPVVSVGNLTTGGTGKTPMVHWIVRHLIDSGRRPVILSRGYRSGDSGCNDEFLQLRQLLPDTPHIQDPDRVRAAGRAVRQHSADVLVLDDGFQHRRLARDLDLVMIDATCPFGYGHLLPRGLLREPPESLRRADMIVLSRADLVDDTSRQQIREMLNRIAPGVPVAQVCQQPVGLRSESGQLAGLDSLPGQRVFAFCGIGNPGGFFALLRGLNCELVGTATFDDHHRYTAADLAGIQISARSQTATMILCTHKDLVKIQRGPGQLPLRALDIRLEFSSGRDQLLGRLQQLP